MNNATQLSTKADKILAALSFLTGDIINWFISYVNNWFINNPEQADLKTVILFSEFNYFKNKFI